MLPQTCSGRPLPKGRRRTSGSGRLAGAIRNPSGGCSTRMSTRGFLQAVIRAERAAQRNRVAQIHAQARAIREAERAQVARQRALASAEKERARLYTQHRTKVVEEQNGVLARDPRGLENILIEGLAVVG